MDADQMVVTLPTDEAVALLALVESCVRVKNAWRQIIRTAGDDKDANREMEASEIAQEAEVAKWMEPAQ